MSGADWIVTFLLLNRSQVVGNEVGAAWLGLVSPVYLLKETVAAGCTSQVGAVQRLTNASVKSTVIDDFPIKTLHFYGVIQQTTV